MNTTPSYDLIIFDCDGVLVDSEPLTNQIFVQMLGEFGYEVDSGEYLRKFSGIIMQKRLEITSQILNWTPPENFLSIFYERLWARTEKELKPVQGIHSLLESLTTPACVASNGRRTEIDLRLKIAELNGYFCKAIFSGMEVPHPKPAPDVYLAAADSFNVPPERCVVIEDSIPGVTAAVQAGMKVYGHAAFTSSESLKAAGAIPFETMADLKKILAQ